MNVHRNFAALAGLLAFVASAAGAQQAQCDIDENSPKEVGTAAFLVQQARVNPNSAKRWESYRKIVKSLTEKGDAMGNPIGRNYQLGKVFFSILEDTTAAQKMTRRELGFVSNPDQVVDVAVLADSTMRVVEAAKPACASLTGTWRRQGAWLRVTQASSRAFNAGNMDSSAWYAQRSMLLDPTAPYSYSILASVAQNRKDMKSAIDLTRKAAEAAKQDTIFNDQRRLSLFNLGILLGSEAETATGDEQKRLAKESAATLQTFLKEAPTDENAAAARSSLARMLSVAGDTAAVRQTYMEVLSNPSRYSDVELVQAGLAASGAGHDTAAVALFEHAVAANPYGRDGLFNLSASLFNTGQHEKMLPIVKRLIAVDPNNPENYRIMAGGYQGRSKAAAKNVKLQRALNDSLVKAFETYEKLPAVVTFRSFSHNGKTHTLTGSVENRAAAAATYNVVVEFLDREGKVLATKPVTVGPVAPKAKGDFTAVVEQEGIVAFRYQPVK
jgi:tetratricopeptide (TPR) repeat protein